ncbi:MAG: hypothetical protein ACK5S5_07495 [Planctomycetota bacterium]|jgi:hypothetical protein
MRNHAQIPVAFAIAAIAAIAASPLRAQTTVPLPPHASVYAGYTRGLQFIAQTGCHITALALPPDARQAGDTASYLVRVNGAVALRSVGNQGAIATSIAIAPGDVVDVLGNWSPASAGNFTARNSYGPSTPGAGAAPYTVAIAGVPHVLYRCGWQWDIGDPAWTPGGATGAYMPPASGQLGRVLVTTSPTPAGVLAGNAVLGQGCAAAYNSFYASLPTATAAAAALQGGTLVLTPHGAGYQGTWLPGTANAFFAPPVAATGLACGDDGVVALPLAAGPLATPQGPQTQLLVSGNGIVAWGGTAIEHPGTTSYAPTPAGMLDSALGGVYAWHDYNAGEPGSGAILAHAAFGVQYVTWNGVESYAVPEVANPSTLQFQFELASGVVRIVFVQVDGNATSGFGSAHLVGVTAPGPSTDAGPLTLATASPAQLRTQDPEILPLALTGVTRPITGAPWSLRLANVPANAIAGLDVFGLHDPALVDLAFLGAPGCGLRASPDVLLAWPIAGASRTFSLAIPNSTALWNLRVFASSVVFQSPPANALGLVVSNGLRGTIGDL